MSNKEICVLGGGSWGTALANVLGLNGHKVSLWSIEEDVLEDIRKTGKNTKYHPGLKLSGLITPVNDLGESLENKKYIVSVLPSQTVREVLKKARKFIDPNAAIISASKGIENVSLKTISEVIVDEYPDFGKSRIAVLSGPSFAFEVMRNLPTAVSIASINAELAEESQMLFHRDNFRTYTSEDIVGVELGGALKNVIALAVGVSDGCKMGHNARAALITRGAAEITRLGIARGANPLTFLGLSGMGDLILTCTGDLSRNRTVGLKIAQGKKLQQILDETGQVVEGVKTAKSAFNLSKKLKISMPITEQVYYMIHEDKNPIDAIRDLTQREAKRERY